MKPTSAPNLIELKEPTKCQLTCVHDGAIIDVAEATVYPNEDVTQLVHGMPLLVGNVRVSIDKVFQGSAPLPIPTRYHERVSDAAGSFVQWPKELIVLGDECHQQPGSTECGYYVMRYMLDIVRHYNQNIADCNKWFGSREAYTVEEVNEVRDLWATYLMTNHL